MGKEHKKAVRTNFRRAVFERDQYRCKCCGRNGKDRQGGADHERFHTSKTTLILEELDAHHIGPREIMPNGGYVAENGISVCSDCHEKAENYWLCDDQERPCFTPEELYVLIGSSYEMAIAVSELLGE